MIISYLKYDGYTIVFQIITAFSLGVILSPWSFGLIFFLIFIFIYEILYAHYYAPLMNLQFNRYYVLFRFGIFCTTLLGWLIGRILINDGNPLRSNFSSEENPVNRIKREQQEKKKEEEEKSEHQFCPFSNTNDFFN